MKGTVVGARVFQDLDGDGVYDVGEPSAITNEGLYNTLPVIQPQF